MVSVRRETPQKDNAYDGALVCGVNLAIEATENFLQKLDAGETLPSIVLHGELVRLCKHLSRLQIRLGGMR